MTHPLRWLALAPLDRAELPSFKKIADWHAEHFPDAPQPAPAGATDKLLTFSIGDFTAAATLVDRPIPWSQLEGPCATAWYWPGAADAMRDHPAHLMITLIDEGGAAVKKSACLTRITAGLAAAAEASGIFWGPGRLVHATEAFIDQAVQMRENNLPLLLWIDFRIEQAEDGSLRLYTTGMEALGQNEIEAEGFRGAPQELLDVAYNVAHYVLDQKKVVNDGDTMGVTDDVQVTIRRGPSMLGGDMEVLRLDFGEA
jgi:hypothetical protein